eukprot:3374841-Pyramimonas_sp.AAC.1
MCIRDRLKDAKDIGSPLGAVSKHLGCASKTSLGHLELYWAILEASLGHLLGHPWGNLGPYWAL